MAEKPKFGHEAFSKYAESIVAHEQYSGMPDVYGKKKTIQWEAPSNRASGEFQYTHRDRLEWWKRKAASVGISTSENNWISRTAKTIHPFKKKPCKNCGMELYIAYRYPNRMLIDRIKKLSFVPADFDISPIEDICALIERLHVNFGDRIFGELPRILSTTSISVPATANSVDGWKRYIIDSYVPQEPATLSPGAMSNAPDRFDGFHSFNRCCRGSADKGRSKENLQTYSTDRRTFEYWVDGDWVAADKLMALVRSSAIFQNENCFNYTTFGSHPVPCQADHIGPISLGFTHRPEFQLLCRSCNSAKNNRMYASDVFQLIKAEHAGERVVSWFAKAIWDKRKGDVRSNLDALTLSKLMRDNRHTYMALLRRLLESNSLTFLTSLLSLEFADRTPEFIALRTANHLTCFERIDYLARTSKYALEQKARRIRIAFEALVEYQKKLNRNEYIVMPELAEDHIEKALKILANLKGETGILDEALGRIVFADEFSEEGLRSRVEELSVTLPQLHFKFGPVRYHLEKAMAEVGDALANMWESDRYRRGNEDEIIE